MVEYLGYSSYMEKKASWIQNYISWCVTLSFSHNLTRLKYFFVAFNTRKSRPIFKGNSQNKLFVPSWNIYKTRSHIALILLREGISGQKSI